MEFAHVVKGIAGKGCDLLRDIIELGIRLRQFGRGGGAVDGGDSTGTV